jgi:predicted DNA-binding protein with PD1-like motif
MTAPTTRLAVAACGVTIVVAASVALAALASRSSRAASRVVIAPPGVRAKLIGESAGARRYQLVLEPGTEAMRAIADFVTANHIEAAHFEGFGACTDAVLAYWDPDTRDYRETPVRQQMEIVSITGDAAPTPGGGAGLHAHMAVAFADGTVHGGHLVETHVSPTMELVLTASPTAEHRRYDETTHGWLLVP